MAESCCSSPVPQSLDQTQAVEARYGAAAQEQEACLCTPVGFDPALLKVIPDAVVERDYGCGDPTRWVKQADRVLDLGSGSGKNAFICSQIVGASGRVTGVDRNADMLALSRQAIPVVASAVGFDNVRFVDGAIEALDAPTATGEPLIADASIDVVLSNCVLNLVNPSARDRLLANIRRVLAPRWSRLPISDIVCDQWCPCVCSRTLISGVAASAAHGRSRPSWRPSKLLALSRFATPIAVSSPGVWWRALNSGRSPSSVPSPPMSSPLSTSP